MAAAYIRTAKGLPTEAAQLAAITEAAGVEIAAEMIWRDPAPKKDAPPSFDQRDYMLLALRDGDDVWIARPSIAANTEDEAERFLNAASARGATVCVASTGKRHRTSPDLPQALDFVRSVRSDRQAFVMERAREARKKLGRQSFSKEQVAKAKKLWADPAKTIKQAEAESGITGRTMNRWWGPKGTPKFGRRK